MQDLYEERRNQFFSDLEDVEQWLQETREAVQEVLQEEREGEVGGLDEAFHGMVSLRSQSDSQAAVDTLIIALKVRTYVLIQWSPLWLCLYCISTVSLSTLLVCIVHTYTATVCMYVHVCVLCCTVLFLLAVLPLPAPHPPYRSGTST